MSTKKLTNEIVDQRLIGRFVKRIDNYINKSTKINFLCLKCNQLFNSTPGAVLAGNNCYQCSGVAKLTNEIIDNRLFKFKIKRIGNYVTSNKKIEFQCLVCNNNFLKEALSVCIGIKCPVCKALTNEKIDEKLLNDKRNILRISNYTNRKSNMNFKCLILDCNHIWTSTIKTIFNGCGCPKCAKVLKITNESIDLFLKDQSIQRLDNVINSKTRINFKCLICECDFMKSPGQIIYKRENCIFCSGNRYSKKEIVQLLNSKNFKLIDEYKNSHINVKIECVKCNYQWSPNLGRILRNNSQCPKCTGFIPFNNKYVDEKLLNRSIQRIDDYKNIYTKIKFQCLIKTCNYIWSSIPSNVLRGTGCPKCSKNLNLTNEIVDQRLKNRNIIRASDFISTKKKMKFQCVLCEKTWVARPSDIFNGSGCVTCNLRLNEKIVHNILSNKFSQCTSQKRIKEINSSESRNLIIDFFINNKIAIEYNGAQHYKPVTFGSKTRDSVKEFEKQKNRDIYLQNFCNQNNIKLIWIDGRKYYDDKLKDYLINEIIPIINKNII